MKKVYSYILYFLLGGVILGGLALFIFRSPAIIFLNEQSGLQAASEVKIAVKSEVLNTDILKTASFTALKDNVINFNFDHICLRPIVPPPAVPVSLLTDNSTTTPAAPTGSCALGSGLPFAANQPKK